MARKYEFSEGNFGWNLERCEEVAFIADYEEVKPFIAPGSKWQVDFETHFYHHGNGVAASYIDEINAERRRKGLERINILETDVLDYARTNNKLLKSENRRRTRDELAAASTDERVKRIERARAEAQLLPQPHQTFEEWKSRRDQWQKTSTLSREETSRRLAAITTPAAPPPPRPKTLPKDKAVVMLKYASADLYSGIIEKLSPDDALELIGEIDDQGVRDALIRHSLAAH